MAFDYQLRAPVTSELRTSGGFDLSTAKPVIPEQQQTAESATVEPTAPEKKLTLPQYSRPIEATRMGLRGLTPWR